MKQVGDRVPQVDFMTRQDGEWKTVSSDSIFSGKTVIVFALPGAFTPTCSTTHLPGYLALAGELHEHGVDDIVCLSVNDGFVMNAWAADQNVDGEVRMVPDGSGHFTRGMGMEVDLDELGFGCRSWRYSMLVEDGVITGLFAEDRNQPGDPFEVSDAMTMLKFVRHRSNEDRIAV